MVIDIFNTENKYDIIYADPPWTYRDKALAGQRGAECKYPVMSIEDLINLPVSQITADNCTLFMWVTFPLLRESFDVIKGWGFTYKTVGFVWVKQNKKADSLFWGMGNWTRSNPEICLIATKGKPKRESASVHSVIMSHIEEHSKKPHEARTRIVELCGDLPRIELFARQKVNGWDCWGNEVHE